MGQGDILNTISKVLNTNRIPFLLTGSLATSYYGYPRATHDIDFVLELDKKSLHEFSKIITSLDKSYIMDIESLKENFDSPKMWNIYHQSTGIKIDFWIVPSGEFRQKWNRRNKMTIAKIPISLISAEDLVLTKLRWCKEIMSERHMRDCVGMVTIQKDDLDKTYLTQSAKIFGVEDLLKQVITMKY